MSRSAADGGPRMVLANVSITLPQGRSLLRGASLTIGAGEFVLLVGASGSGKTTLLRVIADLLETEESAISISGRVGFEGWGGSENRPRVGFVFQNLALFDELSPRQNIQFAIDHAERSPGGARIDATGWLAQLGVPHETSLSRLSGGERQRVAVARTLAQDPAVLLFDEPTTGLDASRAADVVGLIEGTHRQGGRTVIVVTHDYRPFLSFAPRLILLDHRAGALRDVNPAELQAFFEPDDSSSASITAEQLPQRNLMHAFMRRWLESPGEWLLTLWEVVPAVAGGWSHPAWKARYLWHYALMTALGSTAIYMALAGAMLGFVFTSFSFAQLPYTEVTVPLLAEEFLAATGYATYRVVVPLMISVLLAGKCGAAIAADVGTRRLTHQFDALRSFGVRPPHYFYGNAALALLVSAPLLNIVAFAANWYAALVAFLYSRDEATVTVFRRHFLATAWPITSRLPIGTGWVVLKVGLSGLLIAAVSYFFGSRRKHSPVDVSRDVSRTIFWGTLAILALHSAFSFIEF